MPLVYGESWFGAVVSCEPSSGGFAKEAMASAEAQANTRQVMATYYGMLKKAEAMHTPEVHPGYTIDFCVEHADSFYLFIPSAPQNGGRGEEGDIR